MLNVKEQHEHYMTHAWHLALKGWGKVSPNPMVGCVIVKNKAIIAEGFHAKYGEKHAETHALSQIKQGQAKGATMYVTLEPCQHWGKQPPCTEAILEAGIKEVIVGCLDPNPLMNGKSVALLKKAGVKVTVGVLANELMRMNEVFNKHVTTGLPWVVAKTAQTIDGKIATLNGDSKWITSESSRHFARHMRYGFDVIMVGINTVLADNPQLISDPVKPLVKVILDSSLKISSKAKLFQKTSREQVIIFTKVHATSAKFKKLSTKAVVVNVPGKAKRVNLTWVMSYLGKQRISSVLIEGGASVVGDALANQLVDQMMIYVAPKLLGDGLSSIKGLNLTRITQAIELVDVNAQKIDQDILYTGYVNYVHRNH